MYQLLEDMQPGTRKSQNLRCLVTLVIERPADGTPAKFQVFPRPETIQEVTGLLKKAAHKALEHADRYAQTPKTQERARDRSESAWDRGGYGR